MNLSWYFGFGWFPLTIAIATGIAINLAHGQIVWLLYIPFVMSAVYVTTRFRKFNMDKWRRAHAKVMLEFSPLAEQEFNKAKAENREYDVKIPCQQLFNTMFGEASTDTRNLLDEACRKTYYKELVEAYPQIFTKGIEEARHSEIIKGVFKDIDASKLGPDILVAKTIELKHNRYEAARYLHALMIGKVY